jgi:hypothetical protein
MGRRDQAGQVGCVQEAEKKNAGQEKRMGPGIILDFPNPFLILDLILGSSIF